MTRWRIITLIAGAVAGAGVGILLILSPASGVGRNGVDIFTAAFLVACICAPALLLAGMAYALSLEWARNALRWVGTVALAVALAAATLALSCIPSRIVAACDVKRAERYCESLVPLLDSSKARTGRYPDSVDGLLPPNRRVPLLLRDRSFYERIEHDDSFVFTFEAPGSFLSRWQTFVSDSREWRVVD